MRSAHSVARYARCGSGPAPDSLQGTLRSWRGTARHFRVALGPDEVRRRVEARLAALPAEERAYWTRTLAARAPRPDSLVFLALSLDTDGRPIPVVNTDPALRLFLEELTGAVLRDSLDPGAVLQELDALIRPYPVGLLVDGLGPVVANDAYAPADVWERFEEDRYHSPRVVWGREVNLLVLGLGRQLSAALDDAGRPRRPALERYVRALADALHRTRAAVEASGLQHNELWSYRVDGGRLVPVRYGTSSDVQLWNTTELAVEFMLSRLPRR